MGARLRRQHRPAARPGLTPCASAAAPGQSWAESPWRMWRRLSRRSFSALEVLPVRLVRTVEQPERRRAVDHVERLRRYPLPLQHAAEAVEAAEQVPAQVLGAERILRRLQTGEDRRTVQVGGPRGVRRFARGGVLQKARRPRSCGGDRASSGATSTPAGSATGAGSATEPARPRTAPPARPQGPSPPARRASHTPGRRSRCRRSTIRTAHTRARPLSFVACLVHTAVSAESGEAVGWRTSPGLLHATCVDVRAPGVPPPGRRRRATASR